MISKFLKTKRCLLSVNYPTTFIYISMLGVDRQTTSICIYISTSLLLSPLLLFFKVTKFSLVKLLKFVANLLEVIWTFEYATSAKSLLKLTYRLGTKFNLT